VGIMGLGCEGGYKQRVDLRPVGVQFGQLQFLNIEALVNSPPDTGAFQEPIDIAFNITPQGRAKGYGR
jgi:hypothetical protein